MCELSTKLVAWLDGELPDGEAAEVEQHLRACRKCRERLETYHKVSATLNAYCDAALAEKKPKSQIPGWAPVLGAAATLALLLAVFMHRGAVRSPAVASNVAAVRTAGAIAPAPVALAHETRPLVTRKPHKRAISASARPETETPDVWRASAPAIEIAIPGEAVFPPGALPPGMGFVADISLATDGSAQLVRLHPQLTGFEGGPNQ